MSHITAPDISVQITVAAESKNAPPLVSTERRVTPAWTITQLKNKLEPVTGIPASSQLLKIRRLDESWITIDDESSEVGDRRWALRKGGEIEVVDTRPPGARQNFTDVSTVEKYEMPESQYERLSDSVLAWKKRQKLGRFDPNAKSPSELIEARKQKDEHDLQAKDIKLGGRCRVGSDDGRRGVIRFVGEIEGLGGEKEAGCIWVGIELDEPVGRNDGSVLIEREEGGKSTRKVFECRPKFGVFARPEKVEAGNWPPLDDLEVNEDMEEI